MVKDEKMNIIVEDEILDDLSMNELKGGIKEGSHACCDVNHACNVNSSQSKDVMES